ncbi:MAG: virulence factor [Myxococcales bacterium]|nr:virulence factor [Myxococcales bacterium]MDH5306115.1 virulence factor [Myxococcales bacterium]MDH5567518.1 virulence factor [Myxococcales bacterium]
MAKLITVYWRDIPAQVIAKKGRDSVKKVLDPRFAVAIDRAAMRAGRGSSDKYLADWRRESRPIEGDMDQIVSEEVAKLESQFPPDVLDTIVRAGGVIKREDG